MRKVFVSLLAAVAVVVLPQLLTAQDGGRPNWHRPDAKADGSAPRKTFPARPDGKFEGRHEHVKPDGVKSDGPKAYGFARAIFDRLDTNHDGVLSFQEFVAGLRHLCNAVAMRLPNQMFGRQGGMPFQHLAGMPFGGMGHAGAGFAAAQPWHTEVREFKETQTWHFGNRDVVETKSWRRETTERAESRPWQHDGPGFGDGHHARLTDGVKASTFPRHDFGKLAVRSDAKKPECKKPECKKPEAKKPETKKPEFKVSLVVAKAPAGKQSVEARLASLEQQQAEILSLLRTVVKSLPKDVRHDERRQDRRDRN